MAWGYEKSFTVEHDDTVRKKLNCRDCDFYDDSDRSCMKRPLYMPEDGYSQWKNCKYFHLRDDASHYDYKKYQYQDHIRRKQAREVREM